MNPKDVHIIWQPDGPEPMPASPSLPAQGDRDKAAVQRKVTVVARELRAMGPAGQQAAQRVERVWGDIPSFTPSAAYATIGPLESAAAIERSYFARAHGLVMLRNFLILLPLLLTWIALGLAARAYAQELARSPLDVNHPLLELWQRGFTLSSPASATSLYSFSHVAFLDAGLFALLLIVGIFADGMASGARAKAKSAQARLEDVTMEICHYCATLRINESGLPDMVSWSEQIRGTINAAAGAMQNASNSLKHMSSLAEKFQENVNKLQESAQKTSSTAERVAGTADTLATAVAGVGASADAMKAAADAAAAEQKRSADALSVVLTRVDELVRSSSGSAAEVRALSGEIIAGFRASSAAMGRAAATMQDAAERLGGRPPQPHDDDDEPPWWQRIFGRGKKPRQPPRPYPPYAQPYAQRAQPAGRRSDAPFADRTATYQGAQPQGAQPRPGDLRRPSQPSASQPPVGEPPHNGADGEWGL